MSLILHLIRKDLRQQWYWVAAVLLATAFWVLANYQVADCRSGCDELRLEAATNLLLGSWLLFLTAVVHSEALVGDRQYWRVRPLTRGCLLGAKLLLTVLVIIVPLAAAELTVIGTLGMWPLAWAQPMAARLLWDIGLSILPVLALAAVTRNFREMAIWILAIGAAISILQYGYWFGVPNAENRDIVQVWRVVLLGVGSAAIVTMQYLTRRPAAARWGAVGLAGLTVLTPAIAGALLAPPTPDIEESAAPGLVAGPDPGLPVIINASGANRRIRLPLSLEGHPSGCSLQGIEAPRPVELIGADGVLRLLTPIIEETSRGGLLRLEIQSSALRLPARVRGHLIMPYSCAQPSVDLPLAEGSHLVPGVGRCWITTRQGVQMTCAAPFQFPGGAYADIRIPNSRTSNHTLLLEPKVRWPFASRPFPRVIVINHGFSAAALLPGQQASAISVHPELRRMFTQRTVEWTLPETAP